MESEGKLRKKLNEEAHDAAKAQSREMQDAFEIAEKKLRTLLAENQSQKTALQASLRIAENEIASLRKKIDTVGREKIKSRKVVKDLTEIVKELQTKLQDNVQKYEEALRREHNLAGDRIKKETQELRRSAKSAKEEKDIAVAELEKNQKAQKAMVEEHAINIELLKSEIKATKDDAKRIKSEAVSSTSEAKQRFQAAETAVSIKEKMLDAKNEEIRDLKAELDTTQSDAQRRERRWRRREEELELRLAEEEEKYDQAERQLLSSQAIIDNLEGIVETMQQGKEGMGIGVQDESLRESEDQGDATSAAVAAERSSEQERERHAIVSSLREQLQLKQEAMELCEKEIEIMRKRFASCQANLAQHKTSSRQAQEEASAQKKVSAHSPPFSSLPTLTSSTTTLDCCTGT